MFYIGENKDARDQLKEVSGELEEVKAFSRGKSNQIASLEEQKQSVVLIVAVKNWQGPEWVDASVASDWATKVIKQAVEEKEIKWEGRQTVTALSRPEESASGSSLPMCPRNSSEVL